MTVNCTHKNFEYLKSKQNEGGHHWLILTEDRLEQLYRNKPNENQLYFYQKEDSYGEFSNFADYPFVANDYYWRTSEHYYQAQKFIESPKIFNQIQESKTPILAKEIALNNVDK